MGSNEKADCAVSGDGSLGKGAMAVGAGYMREHVITWALSVFSATIVGGAWIHTHPYPRFVAVDVNTIVNEETNALVSAIKPESSREQQEAAIKRAAEFGDKLDGAIAQVASECGCVVVNAAAIVAQPGETPIPDATDHVRRILKGGATDSSQAPLLDKAWKRGEQTAGDFLK